MNGIELTMSVTAAANALACQLSDEQLVLAVAVFAMMHEILATLAVQRELCDKQNGKSTDNTEEALWLSTV